MEKQQQRQKRLERRKAERLVHNRAPNKPGGLMREVYVGMDLHCAECKGH